MIDVAVIGGGASGFYCAIRIKELAPHLSVSIFEKTGKTLTKVRVSGGGRCNVTHDIFRTSELIKNYPRGGVFLKRIFQEFSVTEFLNWLNSHKIDTKIESDGRIFPTSNSSETIAGLFESLGNKYGIKICKNHEWLGLSQNGNGFTLDFIEKLSQQKLSIDAKNLVIATGGIPDLNKISWKSLFTWVDPVPSLFSFNAEKSDLNKLKLLSGVSAPNCKIRIMGEKDSYTGPLLITHWGVSGPAVLKTSAWMARNLFNQNYRFKLLISWVGDATEENIRNAVYKEIETNSKKLWKNINLSDLPNRLWELLLTESGIEENTICGNSTKKQINKLTENLLRFPIEISGKTTFKEEFVTAGGISLESVDYKSMELKSTPGIFTCGEVLDIDGITGGFNFQAAWSTAEIAARAISKSF